MQTPNIIVYGNLYDLSGVTVADCTVEILLAGFGSQLPRVAGTAMLARVAPPATTESGVFTTTLWGNDVITPANTFYVITIFDPDGNVIQTGNYQFTGSGSFDLSLQTPFDPVAPIPVPPGDYFEYGEVPSGAIDGTNATFTLSKTPAPAASHRLYKNGIRLIQGVAYSITGDTITYASGFLPQPATSDYPADTHICDYQYAV